MVEMAALEGETRALRLDELAQAVLVLLHLVQALDLSWDSGFRHGSKMFRQIDLTVDNTTTFLLEAISPDSRSSVQAVLNALSAAVGGICNKTPHLKAIFLRYVHPSYT